MIQPLFDVNFEDLSLNDPQYAWGIVSAFPQQDQQLYATHVDCMYDQGVATGYSMRNAISAMRQTADETLPLQPILYTMMDGFWTVRERHIKIFDRAFFLASKNDKLLIDYIRQQNQDPRVIYKPLGASGVYQLVRTEEWSVEERPCKSDLKRDLPELGRMYTETRSPDIFEGYLLVKIGHSKNYGLYNHWYLVRQRELNGSPV